MSRFYEISVGAYKTWRSRNEQNPADNPGALNISFDFFEYVYAIPMGNSTLTIEGVSLEDLQASAQFAGQQLSMKAGMSPGFPLTSPPAYKPTQAGLILEGQIFQSFGNWVGTEMTLDFVVIPSLFTQANPGNFVFEWKPGQKLEDALAITFASAYAKASKVPAPVFQLEGQYAAIPSGHLATYSTLSNLSDAVQSMTKAASPRGDGVQIALLNTGNTILVFDSGGQVTPTQLQFTDLIGQPTWVDVNVMQFTTVMRADIGVGSVIVMPQGLQDVPGSVTTSAASFPSKLKYQISFTQPFIVQSVRQIGNFRDSNGSSWCTVFQAVPLKAS